MFKIFSTFMQVLRGFKQNAFYVQSEFLHEMNARIFQTNYKSLEVELEYRIIVSLTTHKERISTIHFVLDSLFNQNLAPHEIRLYISHGEYSVLPSILEKFKPCLKVIETDNIGSYKKFIPALREAKENEIIISLDDDFIYPSYLIFSLYSLFLKTKENALIVFNGQDYVNGLGGGLGGGLGVLWNPRIFNPSKLPDFFNIEYFWKHMSGVSADDTWISLNCLKNKIPIVAVDQTDYNKGALRNDFIPLSSSSIDAISSRKNRKINEECEQKMRKFLGV